MKPRTSPGPASKPRGGRRPGAGAPKGNLNALKPALERSEGTGRYSRRLTALRAALDAMPITADMLVQITGRDRRKPVLSATEGMEMLALGLQAYAEMLLLIARGGSIDDLNNPQLRRTALNAISFKQSTMKKDPRKGSDARSDAS